MLPVLHATPITHAHTSLGPLGTRVAPGTAAGTLPLCPSTGPLGWRTSGKEISAAPCHGRGSCPCSVIVSLFACSLLARGRRVVCACRVGGFHVLLPDYLRGFCELLDCQIVSVITPIYRPLNSGEHLIHFQPSLTLIHQIQHIPPLLTDLRNTNS